MVNFAGRSVVVSDEQVLKDLQVFLALLLNRISLLFLLFLV